MTSECAEPARTLNIAGFALPITADGGIDYRACGEDKFLRRLPELLSDLSAFVNEQELHARCLGSRSYFDVPLPASEMAARRHAYEMIFVTKMLSITRMLMDRNPTKHTQAATGQHTAKSCSRRQLLSRVRRYLKPVPAAENLTHRQHKQGRHAQ